MDTQLKLICKAEKTHLPTTFPVYYFGTPHSKVYVVYSMFRWKTQIITAAVLEEFSYNYEEERLFYRNRPILIPEGILNGNEKMKEIQTSNFGKNRLTEIMAKSFLNKLLSSTLPVDKSTHSSAPKDE